MPRKLSELKEEANALARTARLGRVDEKALVYLVNSLVNNLAATEAAMLETKTPQSGQVQTPAPAPAAVPSTADAVVPKKRGRPRKSVTVGNQAPVVPQVTVGSPVPQVAPVEPSLGAAAPVPEQSPASSGDTRTLPLNARPGKGVTVGTQSPINKGVTVGSAPAAPAGQVTVGGRPRKV